MNKNRKAVNDFKIKLTGEEVKSFVKILYFNEGDKRAQEVASKAAIPEYEKTFVLTDELNLEVTAGVTEFPPFRPYIDYALVTTEGECIMDVPSGTSLDYLFRPSTFSLEATGFESEIEELDAQEYIVSSDYFVSGLANRYLKDTDYTVCFE